MPRVDRIRIHNFRGASTPFGISFAPKKPIVVIFGENGTGKTTIVDALDAVGNGSGGSLTTKSSTTLRTHLPTVGKKPADMIMEVSSDGTTWTAALGKSGIVTTPMPRPPIQVLRRVNLQRFIDSPPGDRYKELRHLIGVERVEKSEDALKRALDGAKGQLDEAVRDRSGAESQLENIWHAEGCPGPGWHRWAAQAAAADSTALRESVNRSRHTREAIEGAVRAKLASDQAATAVIGRRDAAAAVEREIAEGPALAAAQGIRLAEMLAKVREHLAAGEPDDHCPVCGQDVRLSDLRASVDERIAELARYEDLSRRQRTAQQSVRGAEEAARIAGTTLVAAAEPIATIASSQPSGFAAIEIPYAILAAFMEGGLRPEERAVHAAELIAACESLVGALQAEEDATLQAAARINSIRELDSRAKESRARTIEVETIVKGLAGAYDVVRRGRIEFTQRILHEVTQECNRLYAEIHPDERIAIAKIELDQQRRASINQTMNFEGYTEIAPQAYLSEAHLDTFGFCFWLAFAKREYPNGDAVLVLDDVFSSVDAPHLARLSDLIVEERIHFAQIIITTHQREWRDAFRNSHGPGNLTDLIELQSWSLAHGIFSYQTPLAIEELRAIMKAEPFDRNIVSLTASRLLEATLDRLTFIYRSQVPRTRENVYTMSELLDATSKLLKKLDVARPDLNPPTQTSTPVTDVSMSRGDIASKLRQSVYIRNQVGAHHNVHGMAVSDADVRAFADLTVQLVESVVCESCGQIPSKSTGTHLRCSCSALLMSPLHLV